MFKTTPTGMHWGRTFPLSAIASTDQEFVRIVRPEASEFTLYLGDPESMNTSGQIAKFSLSLGLYGVTHSVEIHSSVRGTVFHAVAQSVSVKARQQGGQFNTVGRMAAAVALGAPAENVFGSDGWSDEASNGATFPVQLMPFSRFLQITTDGAASNATVQFQQVFSRTFTNGAPASAGVTDIGPSMPIEAFATKQTMPIHANRLLVTTAASGPNLRCNFMQFQNM